MTKEEVKALPLEKRAEKILEGFDAVKRKFGMFSTAGDRRVQALVRKCMKKVLDKKALRQEEFETYVSKEFKKVASQEKYSEVGDTAVRETVYFWLELAIEMADYSWDDFEYISH